MEVKAFFWREGERGELVFRDRTQLIFDGEKNECIGIKLMLNPGSCEPQDGDKVIKDDAKEYQGKVDTTMRNASEIIKEAYANELRGYTYIVNLSDRREKKPKNLSATDFKTQDHITEEIKNKINECSNQVKWIWIAFGKNSEGKDKESKEALKKLKGDVLRLLTDKFPDKIVGRTNQHHPNFLTFPEGKTAREEVVREIKSKIEIKF